MTTNTELFILQDRLARGDKNALSEMYTKLNELAYKNINKLEPERLTTSERQQKAHDAASYIIEQYLKRPDFRIKESFSGYVCRRVQNELYGEKRLKRDKIVEYRSKLPEHQEKKTYKYAVRDIKTGIETIYENAGALFMNPAFKTLRKKRLAECIRTGSKWKHYTFDLIEE